MKDLTAALALMNACEVAEYDDPDTDYEELAAQWARVDLANAGWLAYDAAGRLAGYTLVEETGPYHTIECCVDPERPDAALRQELLERSLAPLRAAGGTARSYVARSYVAHHMTAPAEALRRFGFRPVMYHLRMQIDMTEAPAAPVWPAGVALRGLRLGQDDEAIYTLMKTAFAVPDTWPSFSDWRDFMMRADHFTPEFWFLLWHEDQLIAGSLGVNYPQYGWVRQLGVLPPWRRRGLAGSLLRHSFGAFYAAGHRRVGLGVRANNDDALQLYEKAGMRRARQYDEYHFNLSD